MATDPMEILNRRNAEVAKVRGYADLTEEAKSRKIEEVTQRANEEYQEAQEANKREVANRLESTKKAVFRVPVSPHSSDAEEAQIHAAYRGAFNEVSTATAGKDPHEAQEELERLLSLAERTGDKMLALAVYHRGIDLRVQGIIDSYLASRPKEEKAWNSYTEAYQEANQANSYEGLLGRGLMARAFSSEAAG
jgi:hypothetical protein